jgi:hypothetical protein
VGWADRGGTCPAVTSPRGGLRKVGAGHRRVPRAMGASRRARPRRSRPGRGRPTTAGAFGSGQPQATCTHSSSSSPLHRRAVVRVRPGRHPLPRTAVCSPTFGPVPR